MQTRKKNEKMMIALRLRIAELYDNVKNDALWDNGDVKQLQQSEIERLTR